MERTRNAQVASALEAEGFVVYLPQRDAGVSYDAFQRGEDKKAVRTSIFSKDVQAVADCDILVCLLDGRVPDEGTCIELGMAFALRKPCVGYKTDRRAMDDQGDNNIMVDGCLSGRIVRSVMELLAVLHDVASPPE